MLMDKHCQILYYGEAIDAEQHPLHPHIITPTFTQIKALQKIVHKRKTPFDAIICNAKHQHSIVQDIFRSANSYQGPKIMKIWMTDDTLPDTIDTTIYQVKKDDWNAVHQYLQQQLKNQLIQSHQI